MVWTRWQIFINIFNHTHARKTVCTKIKMLQSFYLFVCLSVPDGVFRSPFPLPVWDPANKNKISIIEYINFFNKGFPASCIKLLFKSNMDTIYQRPYRDTTGDYNFERVNGFFFILYSTRVQNTKIKKPYPRANFS